MNEEELLPYPEVFLGSILGRNCAGLLFVLFSSSSVMIAIVVLSNNDDDDR